MPGPLEESEGDVLVHLKAVPGASRDAIAGLLGERLKIRVSAPPERGKANKAICILLAQTLGVRKGDIEIVSGATSPEKTVRVRGVDAVQARRVLGL